MPSSESSTLEQRRRQVEAPDPIVPNPTGLSAAEAHRRLDEFGPNVMPDATPDPWRRLVGKFIAPIPSMLEAAIVLQLTSSQQKAVLRDVRNLAIFNGTIVIIQVAYASALGLQPAEIVRLMLTAILAAIPVALPAPPPAACAPEEDRARPRDQWRWPAPPPKRPAPPKVASSPT